MEMLTRTVAGGRHEYFVKGKQDKDVTYDAHMKAHDYWLGPWGCEVMP